ncbi:Trp operon leader peptide [Vibrio sp. TRT 21S02]
MLQEFNQQQKAKITAQCAEMSWWRTWSSSWWAHVYF